MLQHGYLSWATLYARIIPVLFFCFFWSQWRRAEFENRLEGIKACIIVIIIIIIIIMIISNNSSWFSSKTALWHKGWRADVKIDYCFNVVYLRNLTRLNNAIADWTLVTITDSAASQWNFEQSRLEEIRFPAATCGDLISRNCCEPAVSTERTWNSAVAVIADRTANDVRYN